MTSPHKPGWQRTVRLVALAMLCASWIIASVGMVAAQQAPGASNDVTPSNPLPSTIGARSEGGVPVQGAGNRNSPSYVTNPSPSSAAGANRSGIHNPWGDGERIWYTTKHPLEVYLSVATMGLLVLLSICLFSFAYKSNTGFSAEFQRSFLLLVVIFAGMYMIVAGYSDRQTAPVFSLLGAIVGYLFGRAPGREDVEEDRGGRPSASSPDPEPATTAPSASKDKVPPPAGDEPVASIAPRLASGPPY
jgi:hypothetical protein